MIIIWRNLLCGCGPGSWVTEASSAFGPENSCVCGHPECLQAACSSAAGLWGQNLSPVSTCFILGMAWSATPEGDFLVNCEFSTGKKMLAVEKITVPIVLYMEVSNSFWGGKIFLRNHILFFFLFFSWHLFNPEVYIWLLTQTGVKLNYLGWQKQNLTNLVKVLSFA